MLKKVLILSLIFMINFVSGVQINEVEMNPPGTDAGAEWVEIFCDVEVELDGWKIVNEDDDELELDGNCDEYFIIEFENQWLDNKDTQLFLYDGNDLVDESDVVWDSQNDGRTVQFCGDWVFREESKGEENDCGGGEVEEDEEDDVKVEKEVEVISLNEVDNKVISLKQEEKGETIIKLNSDEVETEQVVYESKNEKIKKYAVYGFCVFLIFVIVVLLIRR